MNNDAITELLTTILLIMLPVLFILVIVFLVIKYKAKLGKEKKKEKSTQKDIVTKQAQQTYNKQPIFSFMDFDKVEDNMIIRKNGHRYVMVVECKGINYDLMSGVEKTSVEQGFLQFLNTLRHPIQIHVQTRTVNLEKSIVTYREKLKEIEDRLIHKQLEYNSNVNSGKYSEQELENQRIEVIKETNLYEYGRDVIENTEKMSLNKNILSKHYYIIIEYMPEETEITNYGKDEIANMAFSELYTKAQSAINSLAACGINSKILNSNELVELLYMAYNRDEAEVYGLEKALEAGYEDLYSTAPDVIDKRIKALNEKIEEEAIKKANDVLFNVVEEKQKEKELKEKEKDLDDLINQMAKMIIDENEGIVGKEIAEDAIAKIDGEKNNKGKKEGKVSEHEPKTRKRRTSRAS